jgi:hypothetical protein
MRVLFDIFVKIPELMEEMGIDDKAVFDEIVSYFSGRVAPLKELIEIEEGEKACCVMIHFLPPEEEFSLPPEQQSQQIRVSVNGYSPQLTQKIKNSFSPSDGEMINQRLIKVWAKFNN